MTKTTEQLFASAAVNTALLNTKHLLPEYWKESLEKRLAGAVGECYPHISSAEELEKVLKKANWEETHHGNVQEGCRVFMAHIPGLFGLARIEDLPKDTVFFAEDSKGNGKITLTVKGQMAEEAIFTYLITGLYEGVEVIFVFHPGEPIISSKIFSPTELPNGTQMTRTRALSMGFEWAKLV